VKMFVGMAHVTCSVTDSISWPAGPMTALIVGDRVKINVFWMVFGRGWSRDKP